MNRFQFLKEIQHSLVETIKGIYAPLLEDEVNNMKKVISSIHSAWYPLGVYEELHGVEIKYIHRTPIAIYMKQGQVQASKMVCPHCHVMLHYIQAEQRFLCLYCDRHFEWLSESASCSMPRLATKKNKWRMVCSIRKGCLCMRWR